MKNDKFQENLSRPGIIDAKVRRLRNTRIEHSFFPWRSLQRHARIVLWNYE